MARDDRVTAHRLPSPVKRARRMENSAYKRVHEETPTAAVREPAVSQGAYGLTRHVRRPAELQG